MKNRIFPLVGFASLTFALGYRGLAYAANARPHQGQSLVVADHSSSRMEPIRSDIKVYVDGKEMPAVSSFDGLSVTPVVVEGHLMIPIRFVKEHMDQDVRLFVGWGIIQLHDGVLLKLGSREWYGPAGFGTDGLATRRGTLSEAPREIRGRLYMPVDRDVFQDLGYLAFEWDRDKQLLRFTHRK